MKRYPHLNETYVSPRLEGYLSEIDQYPVTLISAPMGSGKTTAMKWWWERYRGEDPEAVLHRIMVDSGDLTAFWRSLCTVFQKERPRFTEAMEALGFPEDHRTLQLLRELWRGEEPMQAGEQFLLIDDAHLLPPRSLATLLLLVGELLPENVHIILLSRHAIFTRAERMCLGRRLLQIPKRALSLEGEEIAAYGALCGIPLSGEETERLSAFSDGWVSLLYLMFCAYARTGRWQFDIPDMDKLITEELVKPLSDRARDLLVLCCATAEFTEEQLRFLWGEDDAEALLENLFSENAFITWGSDGVYRCHDLLRENVSVLFRQYPEEKKRGIWQRLGQWYVSREAYLPAMAFFRQAEDWEGLMDALALDRGTSLGGEHNDMVLEWIRNCPRPVLKARPAAILILALSRFSAGDIPTMLAMNQLLLEAIDEDPALPPEERDNLLGESHLLLGFLGFNCIDDMSVHHRRACALMSRESQLVNHHSPWTFGSPSVLTLYHRDSGRLAQENDSMKDCMPYYYQLTDYHGNGAEFAMEMETALFQGRFQDAEISYYQAARAAARKQQTSISVVVEFTAMRLALLQGREEEAWERLQKLRQEIKSRGEFVLLSTMDICQTWLGALAGKTEQIPSWVLDDAQTGNVMPVMASLLLLARGQALLSMGQWARVVAQAEETIALCQGSHMVLSEIYARIHAAAALDRLQRPGAQEQLTAALTLAAPDGLLLPFAENLPYLRELLKTCADEDACRASVEEILALARRFPASLRQEEAEGEAWGLTQREWEVARLAAERLSKKEIAEKLFLSENTVKSHLKHIFEKLGFDGNERNKSALLRDVLSPQTK